MKSGKYDYEYKRQGTRNIFEGRRIIWKFTKQDADRKLSGHYPRELNGFFRHVRRKVAIDDLGEKIRFPHPAHSGDDLDTGASAYPIRRSRYVFLVIFIGFPISNITIVYF